MKMNIIYIMIIGILVMLGCTNNANNNFNSDEEVKECYVKYGDKFQASGSICMTDDECKLKVKLIGESADDVECRKSKYEELVKENELIFCQDDNHCLMAFGLDKEADENINLIYEKTFKCMNQHCYALSGMKNVISGARDETYIE